MIKVTINVDNYWLVKLFVEIDYSKFNIIKDALLDIDCKVKTIDKIYDTISYDYNEGFTYSNYYYKTSIVGINKATSKDELMNTIIHEIDHVQTDICKYYNISLDSEDAAYLIGYLAKNFYKACCRLFYC